MSTKIIAITVLATSLGTLGITAYDKQTGKTESVSISMPGIQISESGVDPECKGMDGLWKCIYKSQQEKQQKAWDEAHPLAEREKTYKEFLTSTTWIDEQITETNRMQKIIAEENKEKGKLK